MERIQWDDSKADDPKFLAEYYQSVADEWKAKGEDKFHKIIKHFEKGAEQQRKRLTTPST